MTKAGSEYLNDRLNALVRSFRAEKNNFAAGRFSLALARIGANAGDGDAMRDIAALEDAFSRLGNRKDLSRLNQDSKVAGIAARHADIKGKAMRPGGVEDREHWLSLLIAGSTAPTVDLSTDTVEILSVAAEELELDGDRVLETLTEILTDRG